MVDGRATGHHTGLLRPWAPARACSPGQGRVTQAPSRLPEAAVAPFSRAKVTYSALSAPRHKKYDEQIKQHWESQQQNDDAAAYDEELHGGEEEEAMDRAFGKDEL